MVYDSDFYTTRRPYRSSPAYSSYTKREIPWEKVPFVPRPSLVPDPVTAFGKRTPKEEQKRPERKSILHPEERAKIKPKAHLEPLQPYMSARDKSREKIFSNILRRELAPNSDNMDVVLPRLHKVAECPDLPYKRKMVAYSDLPPYEPSRQVRILPGLGKVHVVHSYDRIVPYVGHKRLTVVTSPPRVFSTRPSVLHREYDWIERKVRPQVGYSATNRYLNSDSAVRIYYSSYPITSSYYTTLNLPSSPYYPKTYRWYYDSPTTYTYSWPSYYRYYWPRSYYHNYYTPSSYYYNWPYYRSYLSSFFRNYYLSYVPSLYYRSLDYEFSDLENKINNLSRIYYSSYPITSSYYTTLSLPSSPYYPKTYRWYYDSLTTYTYSWPSYYRFYWPRSYYHNYYTPSSYYYNWPYYRSYLSSFFRNYYLSYVPSLYYRSLDYEFSDLENKINNLSRKNDLYFDRYP